MMMKTNLETRGQRGAAMIEFALVLPLLLIVLLGTVEFSFILYNKAMITNASREGARLGIVYEIDGSTGDRAGADIARCDGVAARAQQYLKKRLVTFDDLDPDPIIASCIYDKDEDPAVIASPCPANCSGFASNDEPGDFLKVEVFCWSTFYSSGLLEIWIWRLLP
jgi:hypothetical protein